MPISAFQMGYDRPHARVFLHVRPSMRRELAKAVDKPSLSLAPEVRVWRGSIRAKTQAGFAPVIIWRHDERSRRRALLINERHNRSDLRGVLPSERVSLTKLDRI